MSNPITGLHDEVRLRPIAIRDAATLHEIYKEPRTMRFYDKPVCVSVEDSQRLVAQMISAIDAGTGVRWAIARISNDIVVGSVGFHAWDRENQSAYLSYEIVPRFRGNRYASAAGRLAIQYGHDNMKLRRILAVIDEENLASIATAVRLGFVRPLNSKEYGARNDEFSRSIWIRKFED